MAEKNFHLAIEEIEDVLQSKQNIIYLLKLNNYQLPPDSMITMNFLKNVFKRTKKLLVND